MRQKREVFVAGEKVYDIKSKHITVKDWNKNTNTTTLYPFIAKAGIIVHSSPWKFFRRALTDNQTPLKLFAHVEFFPENSGNKSSS